MSFMVQPQEPDKPPAKELKLIYPDELIEDLRGRMLEQF